MIPLDETVALLLCAGLCRRYGPGNKLLAPLAGKPLVAYAAGLCARLPFAGRIAVVGPGDEALAALLAGYGLDRIVNPAPETGKDGSIRLGLAAALARKPRAVLVLLGDMPHVGRAHLRALSAAADDDTAAIGRAGEVSSPPTLMPAAAAARAVRQVDRPVRACLGCTAHVAVHPAMLADYDRPDDFERSQAQAGTGPPAEPDQPL